MHVDRASLNIRCGIPDRLEKMRACLDASASFRQKEEQPEFRGSEIDFTFIDGYAMRGTIYMKRADYHDIA